MTDVITTSQIYTITVDNPNTQIVTAQTSQVNIVTAAEQGATGIGVISSGNTGVFLRKNSATDFDMRWSQLTEGANGELSNYRADINTQSATSYTLQAADSGKLIRFNNSASITCALPNSLGAGFSCSILQAGAGQVALSCASGATLVSRLSYSKTAGQYALITLVIDQNNNGTSAGYVVGGDGV